MPANLGAFPDTLSSVSTAELIEAYEAGPARLEEILEGVGEEELRARPIPEKWSILEIGMHVVDSELVGVGRFRTALSTPGAPFHMYSQDRWILALGHQTASREELELNLELLATLRVATGRLLRRLDAEAWDRAGWHGELGSITVRQLLELYADHIERHLAQIAERRRLVGRPFDLTPLLPGPLY